MHIVFVKRFLFILLVFLFSMCYNNLEVTVMIFSNLKVLLAQRDISISKIATDTGISRTTLTALCSNKSMGIQFDTLDTICSYLNVFPSDVILFSPYIIEVLRDGDILLVKVRNLLNNRNLTVELIPEFDSDAVWFNHYTDQDNKFSELREIIGQLPPYYISFINEQIKSIYADCDAIGSFSITTNLY